MSITELEIELFCLLITGALYFFQTRNFQYRCNGYNFVYLFSLLGILSSFVSGVAANIYVQQVSLVLEWCFYVVGVLLWCKYIIKKSVMIKILVSVLYAALTFWTLKSDLNMHTYILIFVMITTFVFDQYNKIRVDNLTKLYNRYGMDVELKEQLRQYEREHEDSFYIISCDLDNFKHINDTWGHLEGDRALVLIAATLSKVAKKFRSNVFRIGGDEFVIITDKSEKGLADDITAALKEELDNIEFRDDFDIKMSIGVALYDGETPVNELLNNADKKMYEAKKNKVKI